MFPIVADPPKRESKKPVTVRRVVVKMFCVVMVSMTERLPKEADLVVEERSVFRSIVDEVVPLFNFKISFCSESDDEATVVIAAQ